MRPLIVTETTNLKIEETYHRNGNIKSRQYMSNNQLHRLDGPAHEGFHEDGSVHYRAWYVEGKKHRIDGPAYESFLNGQIDFCFWYFNDTPHRLDGPAAEYFASGTGKRFFSAYVLHGKRLSKSEHQQQVALLKLTAQTVDAGGVSL